VVEDSEAVFGTGTIARVSLPEAEMELLMVSVVFEKGTALGRLSICQHISDRNIC
jgi:hypothetical protein